MKKKISLVAVVSICLALLYGCSSITPTDNNNVPPFDIEISEEQFAATVNGILGDFSNYVGQTVRLEGVFEYFGNEVVYRSVLRRLNPC